MHHLIAFPVQVTADLEVPGQARLARALIRPGMRLAAQVRPYVVETPEGPVEVADLFFEDGTTAHGIPFASFRFVD
jgi:hypothetical protein